MARLMNTTHTRKSNRSPGPVLPPEKAQELRNLFVRCRENVRISQDLLAAKMGVRRSAISRWENRADNVTIASLHRMAESCGMTLELRLKRKILKEGATA